MSNQPNDKNSRYAGMAHPNADGAELPSAKFEEYRAHIEEFDLSENEQREFLGTLQNIVDAFVHLGWDGSSVIQTDGPQHSSKKGGAT